MISFARTMEGYAYLKSLPNETRYRSLPFDTFDPAVRSYTGQVFRLADMFFGQRHTVEDTQFKRCYFEGPAAIGFKGSVSINKASFEGCGDILQCRDGQMLVGVLAFDGCSFTECYFHKATIVAWDEDMIASFAAFGIGEYGSPF